MIIRFEIDTHDRDEIRHTIDCLEKLLAPAPKHFGRQWRVTEWTSKITAVKTIRNYTEWGLKDAKKLADDAEQGWVSFSAPPEFFEEVQKCSQGFRFLKPNGEDDTAFVN